MKNMVTCAAVWQPSNPRGNHRGLKKRLYLLRAMHFFKVFLMREASIQGRAHESGKQRMCPGGLRFELGMVLYADEPGMVEYFHDFHKRAVGTGARHLHAMGGKLLPVLVIEFIAVPMPLGNLV